MPEHSTDTMVLLGPDVLGNEGSSIAHRTDKETDESKVEDAGWHGRCQGFFGMPAEEHAVNELLDGPGAGTQDQRRGHRQNMAVSEFRAPSVFESCQHFLRPIFTRSRNTQ